MTKPGVAFESLLAALAQLFLGSLLPSGLIAYPVSLSRGAVCEGLAMARRTKKAGGSRRGQEVLPEVGRGILTRVNADGLRALKISRGRARFNPRALSNIPPGPLSGGRSQD